MLSHFTGPFQARAVDLRARPSTPRGRGRHLGAVMSILGPLLLLAGCGGIGGGRRSWQAPAEALGEVYQAHAAALELQGTRQYGGEMTAFRWLLWPDGSWWRSCGGQLEVCDGERVWRQTEGEQARWLGLEEALVRRAEHSLCFGGWSGAESPWVVTARRFRGFDLLQEQGQLEARVEPAIAEPNYVRLRVGDFKAVLGERDPLSGVPQSLEISRAGRKLSTWRVEQVSAQQQDQRAQLDWPGTAAAVDEPHAPIILQTVASSGGRLYLRPSFAGRELGLFMVDTAASVSCIDASVATELDWASFGAAEVRGVGGVSDGTWRRSGSIEIDGWLTEGWPFVELDLGAWAALEEEPVVGLLGAQLFEGRVVVMDPRQGRLELWDAADPALTNWPWQACQLEFGAPCIYATYSLNGGGWFRLDTGSDDTISLHYQSVVASGVMNDRAGFMTLPKARLNGIGGSAVVRRGELDWIQFGDERVSKIPTSFMQERAGPLANRNLAGTLGAGLLSHFRVAYDVSARRVAFLPSGF